MYSPIKTIKAACLYIIISLFVCSENAWPGNVSAFLSIDNGSIHHLKKELEAYSGKKFDHFLEQRTHYNANDFHSAICNLFIRYQSSYSDINTCMTEYSCAEKKYSNSWAKDVVKKYGNSFVMHHIESFKNLIINLNYKNLSSYCIDSEKEGLYSEIQYIVTIKEFFNYYLNFYQTLDHKEKKMRSEEKRTAEDIIKSVSEYPLQNILYGGRVGTYLSLTNKVDLSDDVVKYLTRHPALTRPFNPVMAYDDLVRECKSASKS